MAMAQPYVVAMLVPAATLMMPNSNAQVQASAELKEKWHNMAKSLQKSRKQMEVVPNGTPSNQSDYAQSPWGQDCDFSD